MIDEIEDPLNVEGDRFYRLHFGKRFRYIKHIIVYILDTVNARFRHPMLCVVLITLYVARFGADEILGTYDVVPACENYHEYVTPGRWFRLNGPTSNYVHYLFIIAFLGNIEGYPFAFVFFGLFFSCYSGGVRLYDITQWPFTFPDLYDWSFIMLIDLVWIVASLIWVYCWLVIIFFPRRDEGRTLGVGAIVGPALSWHRALLRWLIRIDWHDGFVRIMSTPFQWPWRLSIGIWISFIGWTTSAFVAVFFVFNIYRVIGWAEDLQDRLEDYADTKIVFAAEGILDDLKASAGDILDWTRFSIKLLRPIFPCFFGAMFVGAACSYLSISLTAFHFKRIWLKTWANLTDEVIQKRMAFRVDKVVQFPGILLVNTIFIQFSVAVLLFILLYLISIIRFLHFNPSDYTRYIEWNSLILLFLPLIIQKLYLPRLIDARNRIRNNEYFALFETWFIFAGTGTSFLRGLQRYILGLVFAMLSAFSPHISVCPKPFQKMDPLYHSFHALVAVYMVERGYIERDPSDQVPQLYSTGIVQRRGSIAISTDESGATTWSRRASSIALSESDMQRGSFISRREIERDNSQSQAAPAFSIN